MQVEPRGKDYRTLRYDLRGHGDTLATEGEYSMELLVRDLVGLLDELNIQRPSSSAWAWAARSRSVRHRHPQRVNALMPCCCRAQDGAGVRRDVAQAARSGASEGVESIVEPTVQRWFSDEFKAANPEVLQKVRNMIRRTTFVGYLGVTAAFLGLAARTSCRRSRRRRCT